MGLRWRHVVGRLEQLDHDCGALVRVVEDLDVEWAVHGVIVVWAVLYGWRHSNCSTPAWLMSIGVALLFLAWCGIGVRL